MDYPFWVNNFDRVKDHRLAYPSVAKIFEQPVSFGTAIDKANTVVTSMMD